MKKKAKTRKKSKSQNAAFEYEGYPHYLRRPSGLDFDTLAPSFPFQPVLTHTFEFMRRDGTPDPDYNAGLIDTDLPFDAARESFRRRAGSVPPDENYSRRIREGRE